MKTICRFKQKNQQKKSQCLSVLESFQNGNLKNALNVKAFAQENSNPSHIKAYFHFVKIYLLFRKIWRSVWKTCGGPGGKTHC